MYQYPYGDSQQLNLDWFITQWNEVSAQIDGSLQAEIDRVEAAITDLLTARDDAVAAQTAAQASAQAAAGSASTASGAANTATSQAQAAAGSSATAGAHALNAQGYAATAQQYAQSAYNSAGSASTSAQNAHNDALSAAHDAATAQTVLNSIPPDYMSLADYAMLTPETFVTRQAYVQNGSAVSATREITIDNGVIEFNTLAGLRAGFIINKLNAANEFEPISTEITSYIPDAYLLSDINIIKGCNVIKYFVTQTGASLPKGLFNIIYCTVSGSTVTKVGSDSVTPSANGYNTAALTIPAAATHYVIAAYQGTSSPTHSDVVLQFSHA